MSKVTVHVFSGITRLPEILTRRLPNIDAKFISDKVHANPNSIYDKVVTSEEISKLRDAEIILADGNLLAQIYDSLPDTQWAHCTWAGIEVMSNRVTNGAKCKFPITRMATQKYSQMVSEYVIGWMLNWEKKWLQRRNVWDHDSVQYRSLQDITVGLLGVGNIGRDVSQTLKFFGCKVMGLGRNESVSRGSSFDKYFQTRELHSMLRECDYLVNTLPSTPETKNLLGGITLQHAKKKPVLINTGRGDIIHNDDVLRALNNNWLSGAILDVTEPEPLPIGSPLWSHPKVVITPHVAALSKAEDVVESFAANLQRYIAGEQLLNVVQWDRGY